MNMGRQLKYKTEDGRLDARKERQMRYYWKNVKQKRENALKRYYDKKQKINNI